MSVLRRLYRVLGSYKLSAYLLIAGIVFYALLTAWATQSPTVWITNIAGLWVFKILYIIFFANLVLCSIQRLKAIKAAFGRPGFRQRFRPLASLMFHLSLLLIPAGVFIGRNGPFIGEFVLAEGQPFGGTPSEYLKAEPANPDAFPYLSFELKNVTARFWPGGFLFEELSADCLISEAEETRPVKVELNRPHKLEGYKMNLTSYGWAPVYKLASGDRSIEGAVNLKIFPSGAVDSFPIPDTPYLATMRVFSDYKVTNGRHDSASFELKNPRIELLVYRGKLEVYRGLLTLGQKAEFEGIALSFPEIREQAQFRVVRDRGLPYIWAGFILALAGLVVRLV